MLEISGNIVDVKTGKILTNQKIIFSNGRIDKITNSNKTNSCYILPGLIDSHVHIILEPSPDFPIYKINEPKKVRRDRILRNLKSSLDIGITTIRDCGYPNDEIFEYQKMFESNPELGSRIISCGPAITTLDGHAKDLGIEFKDIKHLEDIIKKLIQKNVDFIKLINNDDPVGFSTKEISLAVKLAHQASKKVACHIYQKDAIKRAINAKVDTLEHFGQVDQVMVEQIIKNKIIVIPTYASALDAVSNPESNIIEGEDIESTMSMSFLEWTKRLRQGTKLLIKNNAILAIGTDAGFLRTDFQTAIREIFALKHLGASNLTALQAATINGAKALDREKDLGSIEIGKYADFVIYEHDPLENLETLKIPSHIYRQGIKIK